jgi:hypothetical protein
MAARKTAKKAARKKTTKETEPEYALPPIRFNRVRGRLVVTIEHPKGPFFIHIDREDGLQLANQLMMEVASMPEDA